MATGVVHKKFYDTVKLPDLKKTDNAFHRMCSCIKMCSGIKILLSGFDFIWRVEFRILQ